MEFAELIITTTSIFTVGGIGLLGIWALPWSEPELDASSQAFVGAAVTLKQGTQALLGRSGRVQTKLVTA